MACRVSSYTSHGSHAERRPASRVARFWPVTFRHVAFMELPNEIASRRDTVARCLSRSRPPASDARRAGVEVGRTGVSSVVCLERASHSNRAGLETAAYRLAYSAAIESSIEKNTHLWLYPIVLCRACSCIALVGHRWTRCASIGLNVRENVHSGSVASADWRRHGATGPRGTPSRHESAGP